MPGRDGFATWTWIPPWGGQSIDVGPYVDSVVSIVAIVIVAAVAIRLSQIFIRGIVRGLVVRETAEGTAQEVTAAELRKRQLTVETLVGNVVKFLVVMIALLMILSTGFKLDIGPAIAGLGIAGIAVGLGTQSLVRDYLNGALILIENQYAIGDVVEIAGVSGTVEDFTLRRTTLRDLDGTVHTVPNSQITIASNRTRVWARINQDIQVVYGTDLERATEVVDGVGRELASDPAWSPKILEAPRVERVGALGEFGITLKVLGTVRASEQWAVGGELRKRMLAAFREHAIEIPQPQKVILTRAPDSTPPQAAGEALGRIESAPEDGTGTAAGPAPAGGGGGAPGTPAT